KQFPVDPGHHKVVARGTTAGGQPGEFEEEFELRESELYTVRIQLGAPPVAPGGCGAQGSFLTRGQCECILRAKSEEELRACYERSGASVVVRAAIDGSGYADTTHVYVFSPTLRASVSSPTSGWSVGGSWIVDVVTAASPDIVSEASRRFREIRHG